jgi:hypothetical protein
MILVSGPACANALPVIAVSEHAALAARKSRRFIPVSSPDILIVIDLIVVGPAAAMPP